VLEASESFSGNPNVDVDAFLGMDFPGAGVHTFFDGAIDEAYIYNRELTVEEIGWLYNRSWSESPTKYNIELGPEESTQLAFSVKVPENARAGHVQKFLLTTFPISNPENVETQSVTVEVLPKYDAEISLDETEQSGKPSDILTFQAALRNTGNVEDTYDISTEGRGGWDLSLSDNSVTVLPEEVGFFNFSVTVPPDALPGDSASFRIQATSRGDPKLTVHVEGTAVATAMSSFSMTLTPELGQGPPGSEVTFSVELKNLGTISDTINLEVDNTFGWDIEVDQRSLSLEIGETGKATVRVRVSEDALIGQTNVITIRALSSGNSEVSAQASFSVEVVTPFWEIPNVRFLLGLIIGILIGTTLTASIILRRTQIIPRRNQKG
jgi:uncharacterized membrane protein